QFADSGLERTLRLDRFGNGLRIVAAGSLCSFSNDLKGCVGVERVGLRLETGSTELLDELLGGGVLARIGRESHQRAIDGVAGDRCQLVRHDTVTRDEGCLQALVGSLALDKAELGVQAAPVDDRYA